VHNAANAAAVVMTDVTGSNLVIECYPLDVWRERGHAAGLVKTRRCSRRKKPLQTALARLTVNTVQANIFAEESPK
jgi:hypothetical protein